MAGHYQAVGWNPAKKRYDRTLLLCLLSGLLLFGGLTAVLQPDATIETILLRSFGCNAFVSLHVVLSIGPLCRLDPRWLPLLYNRRHLGVATFVLALAHGTLATILYHTLGVLSPLASLFLGDAGAAGFAELPFQPLGAFALAILFVMAATSHDFWLRNLTAPVWKSLHMAAYVAYGLLVLHTSLGYLQSETSPIAAAVVALGMLWLVTLHLLAARREAAIDGTTAAAVAPGFVDVCAVDDIPEHGARSAFVAGERVAVFRHGGRVSAVSGVCKHQNGPLAEGRIVDGCITCPWHGYQYQPHDGCAPAPFTERLATFPVRVAGGRVQVGQRPNAPGTAVEPAMVNGPGPAPSAEFYIGYAPGRSPVRTRFLRRTIGITLVLCLLALGLVAATQRELLASRFEFGIEREFTGVVVDRPCPMLRVPRDGSSVSSYLLVAPGKHGAGELIAPWHNRGVRLRGSLVHHGGQTMIEIAPGTLVAADVTAPPSGDAVPLGTFTLQGEIVDSKCHLGVMNPGERRTHRACAKLCIRGGIPPMLWVENEAGELRRLLLVDVDGATVNDRVLELVGEPVEITGDVEQVDDWLVMRAAPAGYRRLGAAPR